MTNKRFDVSSPRPKSDGSGTYWVRVGTAFQSDKGQISVILDAYPVPDEKGQVRMLLFEPRDRAPNQQPAQRNTPRETREVLDDDIPF